MTRGHLGVARVGLAAPAPGVRVRLVDLEHPNALGDEITGEAGRLDADPVDFADAQQPRQELPIAGTGYRKRPGGQ